jgi:oligopeptide transport system ATP-binding protein
MTASGDSLLEVRGLGVEFDGRAAVDDVSFTIAAGEVLGLVGESGSGKSTLARALLRLVPVVRGTVNWRGTDLLRCKGAALRRRRRDLQMVFQYPLASLDPRMTVGEILAEPLEIFEPRLGKRARERRVGEMLERVGLAPAVAGRYPHEFSGGQCQRIGIARALMPQPEFLVCDEPVSSLDVSIQGQIVNLLTDLQRDLKTAMLFISHNLAVVRHLCDRVIVMYGGRIVETAPREELFTAPAHPYTRALLAAVPDPAAALYPRRESGESRESRESLESQESPESPESRESGEMAWSANETEARGCAYRGRCGGAQAACAEAVPLLEAVAAEHAVACHRRVELVYS